MMHDILSSLRAVPIFEKVDEGPTQSFSVLPTLKTNVTFARRSRITRSAITSLPRDCQDRVLVTAHIFPSNFNVNRQKLPTCDS